MTIDSKISIPDTVFLQEVDNETILLDINTQEYFSLDEVGGIFYRFLKEEPSLLIIVDELSQHFEKKKEDIQNDLFTFINSLSEKNLASIS
jgi:hypothetical protein